MRLGMRFGLSASEKRDVWIRWKAGQTLHEIGRAFEKPHSCIRAVLLPRGGIPPLLTQRTTTDRSAADENIDPCFVTQKKKLNKICCTVFL